MRPFGRDHVHEVHNTGQLPAVSIHVYAPTLSAMTRYELDNDRLVTVSHDVAGVDW